MQLFHSDGVLEIIAGSILLNLGMDLMNGAETASLFTWIPILLLPSIKNRFFLNRVGLEALEADEKQVSGWTTEIAVGLAVWLLAISALILDDTLGLQKMIQLPWGSDNHSLLFGLISGIIFSLAAWLIPLRRLYLYAGVALAAGLIGSFVFPFYVPVFGVSILMLVLGIRLLIKFMRKYPDPEKDAEEVKKKK